MKEDLIIDLLGNSALLFTLTFVLLLTIVWVVTSGPARRYKDSKIAEESLPQLDNHEIEGLKFVLTCSQSPEQYDVYKGDEEVGYVRYRFGNLSADYTVMGDEDLLSETLPEETGILTEQQRAFWLPYIAKLINKRIEKN